MTVRPIKTTSRLSAKTLEEKEAEILSREHLLAFGDGFSLSENDDNVEDFVYNIMVAYKDKYPTHVIDPTTKLITTSASTGTGRHRSLVDLFLLCRYYFPNCTLKEVIKGLYYLDSIGKLGYQTCGTVNRRVYECKIKYPNWRQLGNNDSDELGYQVKDYINIFKSE